MSFDPGAPPTGQTYLFHYTDAESAREIREDLAYFVRNDGRFGSGMYVTDIVPDGEYLDEVQLTAFDGAPRETLDGVVVLVDTDPPSFFEQVEAGIWKRDAQIWEDIDIEVLLLAIGSFDGASWRWDLVEH